MLTEQPSLLRPALLLQQPTDLTRHDPEWPGASLRELYDRMGRGGPGPPRKAHLVKLPTADFLRTLAESFPSREKAAQRLNSL